MAANDRIQRSTYYVKGGSSGPLATGDYRYWWDIDFSTEVANRRTKVTFTYKLQYYFTSYGDDEAYSAIIPAGTSTVYVNGSSIGSINSSSRTVEIGQYGTLVTLGSKTTYIYHNNDGSASFTFQGSGFGKWTATSTYSTAGGHFKTIPSGSVLGSIGTFEVDNGTTVPLTKYVNSYYDVLTVVCKNTNDLTNIITLKTYDDFESGDEVSFTSDELNKIYTHQNTGSSTIICFELRTYTNSNKSTQIGSTSTKNVSATLTITLPTLNGYNYADVNSKTLTLTGDNKIIVKGLSILQILIPPIMEAVANTRQATISYYLANDTKITYDSDGSVGTVPNYSKDHVGVKAVDSRGDASIETVVFFEDHGGFINYSPIVKNDNHSYSRDNNGIGPMVTISFSGTWWQGNFGVEDNTLTASYKFKKSSDTSYTTGETMLTLNTTTENMFSCEQLIAGDQVDNGFDVSESYDIIVIVEDTAGSSVEYTYSIHAGEPAIALYKNKAALGAAYNEYLGGTQIWGTCYLNGEEIGNSLYPVGSIYLSVNNVNPGTFFGGTWEQIKDTFLLACGDAYENGSTGGEATHTLTIEEIPSHKHTINAINSANANGAYRAWGQNGYSATQTAVTDTAMENTGGNQPHNNMPPYLAVYMWKRIA